MTLENVFEWSKFTLLFILATLAFFQYKSANSFRKTQFLSELWRRFYDNETFVEIFDALDRKDTKAFEKISSKEVYKYLAFLEEITLFSKNNFFEFYKIKNERLIHLFQFHFYNIYFDKEIKKMFWSKILSSSFIEVSDDNIEKEIQKEYWKKQYNFAMKCKNTIEN